jgi:hypothetical protein
VLENDMQTATSTTRAAAGLALAGLVAAHALVIGQGGDVHTVVAAAREALGGDKALNAVATLTIAGRSLRTTPAGTSAESDFEVAIALPDKYWRRDVAVTMGNMSIYRNSGFNGDGVINEVDTPPQLSGGGNRVVMFRVAGPGGSMTTIGGPPPTPEQQEASRKALLIGSKQEFARLALGIFVASFPAYPLTMTAAGQAESPDGKADLIDVKGDGDFAGRLFIDATTHLPLMLSWMAKEPLALNRIVGPGGAAVSGTGGQVRTETRSAPPTPDEREKIMKDLDEQAKAAEARRRVVEYRLFYSDYRKVDGITIPHRLQRSIDGQPTEELTFEKVKVNPTIDVKKFTVSK